MKEVSSEIEDERWNYTHQQLIINIKIISKAYDFLIEKMILNTHWSRILPEIIGRNLINERN